MQCGVDNEEVQKGGKTPAAEGGAPVRWGLGKILRTSSCCAGFKVDGLALLLHDIHTTHRLQQARESLGFGFGLLSGHDPNTGRGRPKVTEPICA